MNITTQSAIKLLDDLGLPVTERWTAVRIAQSIDWIPYVVNEDTDAGESQEVLDDLLVAISEGNDIVIEGSNGQSVYVPPAIARGSYLDVLIQKHFLNLDGSRRKPGIIQALVEFLCNASEDNPINKPDLVQLVQNRFPTKLEKAVMASIDSQIPTRLRSVRGIVVSSNKQGYWISADDQ